jgi:uncharacterized protein (DUF2126 family)
VLALGEQVDAELVAGDVRLTMGGEPTFVSVQDRDGAEWNTDALGPTKRLYAQELVHRLRDEYGQGGFLHFGQGKWYPGEQLPRWALSVYWRTDGQPCWRDPGLFADERDPHAYTAADAQRFLHHLGDKLGLVDVVDHVQTGFEDTFYYLWRERRLPVNVDPLDSRLDDEMERARLCRVFTQGLESPVGYVLPLKPVEPGESDAGLDGPRWVTGPWFFRDERMYLFPGDSPMGYRLPLDSLPWVRAEDFPHVIAQDPFAPRSPLPVAAPVRHQSTVSLYAKPHPLVQAPQRFESARETTRTALCVEVRDPRRANGPKAESVGSATGVLYVFMPPLARLEEYLDLLAAVETTAAELGMKILLEGYPPPRDPRLTVLQVTPDPGVIEVNIHPAKDWSQLVQHTEFLYDAAWKTRLSTEKFLLDGRHTGTGGGNHMVMGGATPAASPTGTTTPA